MPEDRRWIAVASAAIAVLALVLWIVPPSEQTLPLSDRISAIRASTIFPTGVFLAALVGFGLISVGWSIDRPASAWASLLWIGSVAYFAAGVMLVRREQMRRYLLPAASVFGFLVAAVSLVGYAADAYPFSLVLDGERLAGGPFGYANAAAAIVFLLLPATIGWAAGGSVRGRRPPVIMFGLVSAACQAVLLILAKSRLAPIVILVPAALWLLLFYRARIWRALRRCWWPPLVAIVVVVGIGLAAWQAEQYVAERWTHVQEETASADQHRLQVWYAAVEAGEESPWIGHGIDTFYPAYIDHRIPWTAPSRYAHNVFIQEWVELGVVGLVLLVGFLVLVFVAPFLTGGAGSGVREVSGDAGHSWRDPQPWLWCGALAFVLQNLVDVTWYFPSLFLVFMLIAGVLAGSSREVSTNGY